MDRFIGSLPRRSLTAGLLLVLAVLGGCSKHHSVTAPPASRAQPPVPDSPEAAVRLFEWSWNRRDTLGVYQLLADDFRFHFEPGDSVAANLFPGHVIGRQEMLCIVRHLFVGGGSEPRANSITLKFDPALYPQDDSRPGNNPAWHREILTNLTLEIECANSGWYVAGTARFFLVRGDSAAIPPELAARGFRPDSTRWYLDRWNDGTLDGHALGPANPADISPSRNVSWGEILTLYK